MQVLKEHNGLAQTANFVVAGISILEVARLCNFGFLERVRHGYYCLADRNNTSERADAVYFDSTGIVCTESELFYYGYSDFSPRKWSIIIPRIANAAA